jgi:hypothetical protein
MKTLFRITIAVILTLTLTGGINAQRDITVPAGVTLELTEDGGIYLMRDNITLTANGTEET